MVAKSKQAKKKPTPKTKQKSLEPVVTIPTVTNIPVVKELEEVIPAGNREKYMSLGDHLEELRQRLIHCLFIVGALQSGFFFLVLRCMRFLLLLTKRFSGLMLLFIKSNSWLRC